MYFYSILPFPALSWFSPIQDKSAKITAALEWMIGADDLSRDIMTGIAFASDIAWRISIIPPILHNTDTAIAWIASCFVANKDTKAGTPPASKIAFQCPIYSYTKHKSGM